MPNVTGYQGNFQTVSAVIANGQTKSGVIAMAGFNLVGIILATMTGTALTFEASDAAAGTFVPVKKADGSSLSYTTASNTYVAIDPKDFYGIAFLKIVSGSSEGAARTLKLALKGF